MSKSTVSLVLFLMVMLPVCSRQVIRQPVAEIDRPLFLPERNWQVSFGAGIERRIADQPQTNYDMADSRLPFTINGKTDFFPVFNLLWPSIPIGDKIEIYAPTTLRWYLVKNTEKIDDVERVTGVNSAMVNGISGFSYSGYDGFRMYTRHTFPVKARLSARSWFSSNPGLYFVLPLRYPLVARYEAMLCVPFSIGYQISERWSCKGTFSLLEYYEYFNSAKYAEWIQKHQGDNYMYISHKWDYTSRIFDLDLKIPLQTTYVFSPHGEVTFLVEGNIYDKSNSGVASALWFTFTW